MYVNEGSPSKQLEYYTFGHAAAAPSGPEGLRLRDADGTVYYDSRRKGLRVLAAVPLPVSVPTLHVGQFFPGVKIGLALANARYYYRAPYPEICYMYGDFLHLDSSNNVHVSQKQIWYQNRATAFTVGDFTMANSNATLLVVDLTEVPLGFTA